MSTCRECGAPERRGLDCRAQWEDLLALEFSDLRAGRVHFLTVACYQLQHPVTLPVSSPAREALHDALVDVVVHGTPVSGIRDRMSHWFEGGRRVRAHDVDVEEPTANRWSRTVADLWPPDPDTHAERVQDWARAILADLRS